MGAKTIHKMLNPSASVMRRESGYLSQTRSKHHIFGRAKHLRKNSLICHVILYLLVFLITIPGFSPLMLGQQVRHPVDRNADSPYEDLDVFFGVFEWITFLQSQCIVEDPRRNIDLLA